MPLHTQSVVLWTIIISQKSSQKIINRRNLDTTDFLLLVMIYSPHEQNLIIDQRNVQILLKF